MTIRTSETDPIQVASIKLHRGEIGITFCPGKHASSAVGFGTWQRDLDTDLKAISDDGWHHLVTLVEHDELDFLNVPDLGSKADSYGLNWIHFPIPDGDYPRSGVYQLRKKLLSYLNNDERVVVHCRGGLGRAGTLAATMLVDSGEYSPEESILKVRAVRRGAIENEGQEQFIRHLVPVD